MLWWYIINKFNKLNIKILRMFIYNIMKYEIYYKNIIISIIILILF